ncbi:MAG: hypothetical protein P4L00_07585, partial [Candidatus Acidoferrales bacterium]|nr:hypothetical protein [Candidatus Acidoferrales bacterium]
MRVRDAEAEHSFAIRTRAQIPAQKRQDVVLETISNRARMGTVVDLKGMCDAILIEHFVQLAGVALQTILVAYIDRDAAILLQVADVL